MAITIILRLITIIFLNNLLSLYVFLIENGHSLCKFLEKKYHYSSWFSRFNKDKLDKDKFNKEKKFS